MNIFGELFRRIWYLLNRGRVGKDLQKEMDAHRAMMDEPIQFGNTLRLREESRDVWGWNWLDQTAADVRYALRLFGKNPAFTMTALLSLAIGIGMNTAMFSLLDAVLLRNLPVQAPENLVLMAEQAGSREIFSLSTPAYRTLRESNTLTGLAAFRPWTVRTTVKGESQLAYGQLVSGSYFSVLGIQSFLGRPLTEQDDQLPQGNAVAVLSYGYWQRAFASDRNVIGQSIEILGNPFTVVGVTGPDFVGLEPGKEVDVTVPLSMQPVVIPGTPLLTSPNARWLRLIGRRKADTPLSQVQADLAVRWDRMQQATSKSGAQAQTHIEVLPGGQGLYDLRRQFSLPLRVLMAAVVIVLLIACANLASLLLARASARRQEIGLRMSLGASRGRLLRQLLTESILLSSMGGICGVALAYWGIPLLLQIMSRGRDPLILDLAIHTRTLLFTATVSLVTGLLFGIAPALRSMSAGNLHGTRLIHGKPRRWSAVLIVTQVSLCLIMLACSGLLMGSLRNLRSVDAGFREDHVLLMSIRPALSNYHGQQVAQLYEDLYQRLSALPEVQSTTLSMDTPLGGVSYGAGVSLSDSVAPQADALQVSVNSVGPQFFETMGIPLIMGRDLGPRDDNSGAKVAVISESVATSLFQGRNPLGASISIGPSRMEIVGVVGDARYQSLRAAIQPMVYRPYLQVQNTWEELFFGIRTSGNLETLRPKVIQTLHEVAPEVPVFAMRSLEEQVDATLVQERMVSALSAWFGGFALLLAAIGLYGRLAYAVVERTREIGIRLALGAQRRVVMWEILREVLALVICGVVIGLPFALASTRAIKSLLYGLAPSDPLTLGEVVVVIITVGALAGYIPARRAARVDPMVALRYE